MQKVILFGMLDPAQLAYYYLQKEPDIEIVGFTVHEQYMPEIKFFKDLPVVPFESITTYFSPSEYKLFAPMTGRK